MHSGEVHGIGGKEEGRGKDLAAQQGTCMQLLTEETDRRRRYCTIHSVQMKVAIQSLRRFSNVLSKEGWIGV